jgi:membrane protein implicated in regulation of membrane protease activity
MRRIDAIAIVFAFFVFGGIAFWLFRISGLDTTNAGVWSQVVLVGVLLAWVSTYIFRAITQTMTYNQQLDDYQKAFLAKQLEAMSPEEREKLMAEVEAERDLSSSPPTAPKT